jgi:ECF transporter S component (folate family)
MSNANKEKVEKLLFSKLLRQKNRNHKLAYVALITSLVVVANMFFEFKFMDVQFSLTIAVSAFAGILLGPLLGFAACFLGDLVGFLYNSGGFAYMPWIGLSMALTSAFAGIAYNLFDKDEGWVCFFIGVLVCVLSLLVCTIGINTTAFWLLYSPTTPYGTYLAARLFAKGQIFNCLFNYVFIIVGAPILKKLLYKSNRTEK